LAVGSAVRIRPLWFFDIYRRQNTNLYSTVGLPAIFWFYMNKGRYFQNWKKAVLTITNIGVLAIAFAIVSLLELLLLTKTNLI
jgi:hypothetical protein